MTLLLALAMAATDPPGLLLGRAETRVRAGDYPGARALAEEALAQPGDHQRRAQLLIGTTWELAGDPGRALAYYEPLADAYPRREVPPAIRLREATALASLGAHRQARRTLRRIGRPSELHPQLALQVEVLSGLWDLERGRDARGLAQLHGALASDAPSPWWRAQGHAALAAYALAQVRALPPARDAPQLEEQLRLQAELVAAAQEQVVRILRVDELGVAQRALIDLAETLEGLGKQLETTPHLDANTRAERAAGVYLKALAHVHRALSAAQRRGAPLADQHALEALRDRLQASLEAVDQRP